MLDLTEKEKEIIRYFAVNGHQTAYTLIQNKVVSKPVWNEYKAHLLQQKIIQRIPYYRANNKLAALPSEHGQIWYYLTVWPGVKIAMELGVKAREIVGPLDRVRNDQLSLFVVQLLKDIPDQLDGLASKGINEESLDEFHKSLTNDDKKKIKSAWKEHKHQLQKRPGFGAYVRLLSAVIEDWAVQN